MNSVIECNSSEAVNGMLNLVQAQDPVLDVTWGNGTFWKGSNRNVIGLDIDPDRAKDMVADFKNIPLPDASFPTVVFDPPFHPIVGSREFKRFKGMGTNPGELKYIFQLGCLESWRVSSRHILVKCQGYIHNHSPQWMPLWAIEVLGEPFEWLIVSRSQKVISGRWVNNFSLRRNHADYLLFDKRSNKR